MIVEHALVAAEVPFEIRDVPLSSTAQRESDYAKLNPRRKLPTLITPEGEVLSESAAILLTLSDRHPEAQIFPSDRIERAQAYRWLLTIVTELYPLIEILDYPERFTPEGGSTQATHKVVENLWRTRWTEVEAQVLGDPWLLKNGPYANDFAAAVVSRWAQQEAWRPAHIPRVETLANALATHPLYEAIWKRHQKNS